MRPPEVARELPLEEEQKGMQRETSVYSGTSEGGNMVTDQPIQPEDTLTSNNSDQSHSSCSGRSTPESDSTSKSWLIWRKRSKIIDSFRIVKERERRKTSSSQEDIVSDNSKVSNFLQERLYQYTLQIYAWKLDM